MERNLAWGANSFWPSQEISHVYPIRWFFALLTRPWYLSLFGARSIQSTSLIPFLEDPFYYFPSIDACGFQVVFIPQVSLTKPLYTSISPYMQRGYALHESTNVRHFKSLCCVYSYDPHLKTLVDFHEIRINLCDWRTPRLRNRRSFVADTLTSWQNTAGSWLSVISMLL